jgi:predicted amidohydrolase
MSRKSLIAVGQFRATSSLTANLAACETLVAKSTSAGAKILFLPEASDYIASTPTESVSLCQPLSTSPFVTGLQTLARQHGLSISVGVHTPSPLPSKCHNTILHINNSGEIAHSYNKLHLFTLAWSAAAGQLDETHSTLPGKVLTPPFDTPAGRLGSLCCFDLRFPEVGLRLRRLGAEVLAYPSAFTVPTGRAHWEVLLRARAVENGCYVVAAAQVGWHGGGRRSWGEAMVVDPWGTVVGRGRSYDEVGDGEVVPEAVVVEVDLGLVEEVRGRVPLVRRWDVYPEV